MYISQLTKSKIATYLTCQMKFKLDYVDKVPKKSSTYAQIGTLAHRALEIYMAHGGPPHSGPNFEKSFDIALREGVITDGTWEGPREAYNGWAAGEAKRKLEKWFESRGQLKFPHVLETEHNFTLSFFDPHDPDQQTWVLNGIADRISLSHTDNEKPILWVTDYKTGKDVPLTEPPYEIDIYLLGAAEYCRKRDIPFDAERLVFEYDYVDRPSKFYYRTLEEVESTLPWLEAIFFEIKGNEDPIADWKGDACRYCSKCEDYMKFRSRSRKKFRRT